MPPTRSRRSPSSNFATRRRSRSRLESLPYTSGTNGKLSIAASHDKTKSQGLNVSAKSSSKDEVDEETILSSIILGCCQVCAEITDLPTLLLCDGQGCGAEIHMGCLTPPVDKVPEDEWFCPTCVEIGNNVTTSMLNEKSAASSHFSLLASGLKYRDNDNDVVGVRIIINEKKIVPPSFKGQFTYSFLRKLEKASCAEDLLDNDFDEYICSVCKKGDDVFYCDSCPKLFHEKCIPYGPAKLSFERGDNVWNCHRCIYNEFSKALSESRSQRNREKCVECKRIGGKMDNCSYCGACFHPFCRPFQSSDDALCTSCRNMKDGPGQNYNRSERISRLRSRESMTTMKNMMNAFVEEDNKEDLNFVVDERTRDDDSVFDNDYAVSFQKSKPRMIPMQLSKSSISPKKRTRPDHLTSGHMKPTPGFFLYMRDKRKKLQNTLTRRVKKFKKLDELEQSMLIAKEIAVSWSREALKVRRSWDNEVSSNFNQEVRAWISKNAPGLELAAENGRKRRSKAMLKTSKKSRAKETTSDYRNLQKRDGGGHSLFFDILRDIRFHPLPVFGVSDEKQSLDRPDYEKMTIAKFVVQGPFSTSIGDDCVGCTRGWCHFCPVLKRMLPAVEHRSRLQPPTSTLVATRIAIDKPRGYAEEREDYLSNPDDRIDDLTLFVQDMTNINNPSQDESGAAYDKGDGFGTCFQCKCGVTTHSIEGCNHCRRKKLIGEWIKKPAAVPVNIFKADSLVMFRAPLTANKFDALTGNDRNIARMLCHQKWKPIKMLSGDRSKLNEKLDNTASKISDANINHFLKSIQNTAMKHSNGSRRSKRSSSESMQEKDYRVLEEEARARLEASNELNKRCRSTAICGVFLACTRRDPLRLFAEPVRVPGYESHISNPIDLGLIRSKIIEDKYTSFGSFVSDMKLLYTNAISFNPPSSIYARTAEAILDCLDNAQRRAKDWMEAVKNSHSSHQRHVANGSSSSDNPFVALEDTWPGATSALKDDVCMKDIVKADFLRTKENENAYYGSLVTRRAVMAASTAITSNIMPVVSRSVDDDDKMRSLINQNVAKLVNPVRLLDEPGWRESNLIHYLHAVQNRRVELKTSSKSGCARTDNIAIIRDTKLAMIAESLKEKRSRNTKQPDLLVRDRVHPKRSKYSLSSQSIKMNQKSGMHEKLPQIHDGVDVRGSSIHGWGLFAECDFMKGDVVAEYLGEIISNAVADKREKIYKQRRIEDYQFRVSPDLVIDATFQGGPGRYINHSCSPSCIAEIVDGSIPFQHLKTVIIKANRNIAQKEEITYDYQFPLELDLKQRIPCNCGSYVCRGYMNWDLPEKTSTQLFHGSERIRDRYLATLKGGVGKLPRGSIIS